MMKKMLEWIFTTSKTCVSRRLLLGVSGWALLSSAMSDQAPRAAPRCDLESLNYYYIKILNQERHKVNATAPIAHFDRELLVGTIRHNERVQRLDSLFHDPDNRTAELAGTLLDDAPTEPAKLARYVFERLKASLRHCEIQGNADYTFISVSASENYYIVRLSSIATPANPRAHPLTQSNR